MFEVSARALSPAFLRAVRRPVVLDVATATCVGLVAQVEVWQGAAHVGSEPVAVVALLVGAVALLWRRSQPLVTAAVVGLSQATAAVIAGPMEGLGPGLLLVIAAYSVVVYSPSSPVLRAGVAILLASNAVRDVNDPLLTSAFAYLFSWVMLAAAFTFGATVRAVRARASTAEGRLSLAERERDLRAREAVLAERERIARELHDVVAHHVSVMVLHAGVVRRALTADQDEQAQALRIVADTGREALTEMRQLVGVLRQPSDPVGAPGLDELPSLVAQAGRAGLAVTLDQSGDRDGVPQVLGSTAYRIVQESLTNTRKHAHATSAHVKVQCAGPALRLEISDDGVGASPAQRDGHGYGLLGMSERARLVGGSVSVSSDEHGGFVVRAVLPLPGVPGAGS